MQKKPFSIRHRAHSLRHAISGVALVFKTEHNAWIQSVAIIAGIALGCYFRISAFEWMALVFSMGLVVVSEAFNTAIEIDIDLTSPEIHPYAKKTKDVAAGAVLLSALTALVVALIIFLPKIFG